MDVKNIEAKELTVGQVKAVLEGLEKMDSLHTIDFLFPEEGVPALAVSLSTGLSLEELNGDIPVSEMQGVVKAVKEKNAFFLRMLRSLAEVGKLNLQARGMESGLTGPSVG